MYTVEIMTNSVSYRS